MSDPARPPARALRGYSGADLLLVAGGEGWVVRKGACTHAQNDRLRAQCRKLRDAHAQGIACPAVVSEGEAAGRFFFDMEYVPGESLAHAVMSGRRLTWERLLPQMLALLERFRQSDGGEIPPESFRVKLRRIAAQCRSNPVLASTIPTVERAVEHLCGEDWGGIPDGASHGDLTLENILVRPDGRLMFIDFDVAEHSSWQLDIGKLYQDVRGHWCLRHLATGSADGVELLNAQFRMEQVAVQLEPAIGVLVPGGAGRVGRMAAFHLLRTLPYATEAAIPAYVARRLAVLLGGGNGGMTNDDIR